VCTSKRIYKNISPISVPIPERQSLAAATIPQRLGHCTGSELMYVECTEYVRVQGWTGDCE
jgi:hypothetical protein